MSAAVADIKPEGQAMHIWFNSLSTEADILTHLRVRPNTSFNDLLVGVIGDLPRLPMSAGEAAALDYRATLFFQAMGKLLDAGYVQTSRDTSRKQVFFSVRGQEETRVLLEQCAEISAAATD